MKDSTASKGAATSICDPSLMAHGPELDDLRMGDAYFSHSLLAIFDILGWNDLQKNRAIV